MRDFAQNALTALLWLAAQSTLMAQDFTFGGYVSGLYVPIINFEGDATAHNGILHNRLNLKYDTPNRHWSFVGELRNRILYPTPTPTHDNGWVNLSVDWYRTNKVVLNTSVERLNVSYKNERFGVTLGRQRINWSQTLIFNPNDIFNSYSLFDYDYIERSGSDALRLCYYPSSTSVIETAIKINRRKQVTAAALHRFNVSGYDIQYLVGVVDNQKMVIGGGFSGEVKGVNLRTEFSNFYNTANRSNTILVSLGADYIFPNSLSLSAGILYNQQEESTPASLLDLYQTPLSSSRLAITQWTLSTQLSYPFTPIFSGSFTFMSFLDLPIFYFGPSADLSLTDDLTISLMAQLFASANPIVHPSGMGIGYLRLKYNF